MYEFRDRYAAEWELDFRRGTCPPLEEIDASLPPAARSAARKTEVLRQAIAKHELKAVIAGIRRDEQATRAKERVFSPRGETGAWDFRDQPPEFWDQYKTDFPPGTHIRIHPLLHWTELDIWLYTRREEIPIVPPYLSRDGKRYRSLGDQDIPFPTESEAASIDEIIVELKPTNTPERPGPPMDPTGQTASDRRRATG